MRVHAIVTQYDTDAYGLSSPQFPALFAGSDNRREYEGDSLLALLREAGCPQEVEKLFVHRQRYYSCGDREWFVRCAQETHSQRQQDRDATLRTLLTLLSASSSPVETAPKATTGEALFVVVLPTDRARWIGEQLAPDGLATLALLAEEGLLLVPVRAARPGDLAPSSDAAIGEILAHYERTRAETQSDFLTSSVTDVASVREPVCL